MRRNSAPNPGKIGKKERRTRIAGRPQFSEDRLKPNRYTLREWLGRSYGSSRGFPDFAGDLRCMHAAADGHARGTEVNHAGSLHA